MTSLYMGWTPSIPEDERRRNEIETCRLILADNPDNEWYQNRLAALLEQEHAQ